MEEELPGDRAEFKVADKEFATQISRRRFLLGALAGGAVAVASRFFPPLPDVSGAVSNRPFQPNH